MKARPRFKWATQLLSVTFIAFSKRETLSCQWVSCIHVRTLNPKRTAPAAIESAILRGDHPDTRSETPQAIMIDNPIIGTYIYRSAIDCNPTCTMPITGTRVPRYHNHPTTR